ncbi:MAG: hypothetical protein GY720_24065 [bacterium]|nr:hypothetical protein [bacterium]
MDLLDLTIAIAGSLGVVMVLRSPSFDGTGRVRTLAKAAAIAVGIEAIINVALLTPVEIQMIHLQVADVLWILATLAVLRIVAATTDVSGRLESV